MEIFYEVFIYRAVIFYFILLGILLNKLSSVFCLYVENLIC